MATLDTHDPKQVASAQVLDVDLGVGGRRLIVASGIARPIWKIDADEVAHALDTILLHIPADHVEQVTVHVGLASITNDDSSYTFAVDEAVADVDATTGEMILKVKTALMGEWSRLGCYSYQMVAVISRDLAEISGTIHWPRALFDPPALIPSALAGRLNISLNTRTVQKITFGFGGEHETLVPVLAGEIVAVSATADTVRAKYRIVAPPKGPQLRVVVAPNFPVAAVAAPDAPGSDIFTLDLANPGRAGVDFRVVAAAVIR